MAVRKSRNEHSFNTIAEPEILRTVLQNDIFIFGLPFAILCQFAHPALAKGSYSHSNFSSRLELRLRNTLRFSNAVLFGTQQEKQSIVSVIHRHHSRVKGAGYDADDPELHKWTAATIFMSILNVHEEFIGKLPQSTKETLLQESAIFGSSLRMPPTMWPSTMDEFWKYWNHNISTLQITPEARRLSQHVLYPQNTPLWMSIGAPLMRLVTASWLPDRLAREYSFQPSMMGELMYYHFALSMRVAYPLIPAALSQRQHRFYMNDLKETLKRLRRD
ncbi:hypothetical protein ASPVEDRAFT_46766 [Aspergillus versicolor CBS 583.65]|uniref:ER-bound oxygenase mpaB/mpaB'/Rubber oxygenase catalytic domain-containing protein n=1 Tax=Aspergillus versicolor CBS 583.65 TaxID=1036611 RepID=A0A1L9Q116_ASPVE|nr:uncharacterized protein ASPVEDRAFT_46766 [Aspergillus versicolor CBS 583.65]OJJ07465.1 hypothetical protein ASPVEDRAFT_46766 [Aspergillus versicolor CBS 583.65]